MDTSNDILGSIQIYVRQDIICYNSKIQLHYICHASKILN